MVGHDRYFNCDNGRGLFVKEKWCRRSFVQRPPRGVETKQAPERRPSLSEHFNVEPSPLHTVGVLDLHNTRVPSQAVPAPPLRHQASRVHRGSRPGYKKAASKESTASSTLDPVSSITSSRW